MPIYVTFESYTNDSSPIFLVPQGSSDVNFQDYIKKCRLDTLERDGPRCGSGPALISHQFRQPDEDSILGDLYYPTYQPIYRTSRKFHLVTSHSVDVTDSRNIRVVTRQFYQGIYIYSISLIDWYGSTCTVNAVRVKGEYRKGTSSYRDKYLWQVYYNVVSRTWRNSYNLDYLLSHVFDPEFWDWSLSGDYPTGQSGQFYCDGFDSHGVQPMVTFSSQFTPLDRGEWVCWASHCWGMPYYSNPGMITLKGFGIAYYDALDKIPTANQNMIANIMDIVSIIKSFREGFSGIANSLKDLTEEAWMAYRYQYSTTKSDIEEMAELCSRLAALSNSGTVKCYGTFRDDLATYKCEIEIDPWYFFPKDILGKLRQYGVKLSLQNIWDMVPYSFVVDWFFDVSSALAAIDKWLMIESLPITHIWYSFMTSYDDGSSCYGRFSAGSPRIPYTVPSQTSTRTWWMRIADSIALFT